MSGWHDFVGTGGVVLILIVFLLVQLDRIDTQGIRYSAMNAIGAGLLCISLLIEFNLSAFLMEASWLAISLFGLYRYFTRQS
jgi:hypothetical protein